MCFLIEHTTLCASYTHRINVMSFTHLNPTKLESYTKTVPKKWTDDEITEFMDAMFEVGWWLAGTIGD